MKVNHRDNSDDRNITMKCFRCVKPGHKISECNEKGRPNHDVCNLLVDTGATAHIIRYKSKFVRFDEEFDANKHIIELADDTRTNNIFWGKGDAIVTLHDKAGIERSVTLKNALYIFLLLSRIHFLLMLL